MSKYARKLTDFLYWSTKLFRIELKYSKNEAMHAFLKNSKSSSKDKAKSSQDISTVNRKKTPAPWVEK